MSRTIDVSLPDPAAGYVLAMVHETVAELRRPNLVLF